MAALSMALTLNDQVSVRDIPTQLPLFTLAGNVILGGALCALGIVLLGGILLVISTWRSTPRSRFLLLVPLRTLGLVILYYLFWIVGLMTNGAIYDLGRTFQNVVDALPYTQFSCKVGSCVLMLHSPQPQVLTQIEGGPGRV